MRRHAAHRHAHDGPGVRGEGADGHGHVLRVPLQRQLPTGAVARPVGVAVAGQVDGDERPPERHRHRVPGVGVLRPAVEEHQLRLGAPPDQGAEATAPAPPRRAGAARWAARRRAGRTPRRSRGTARTRRTGCARPRADCTGGGARPSIRRPTLPPLIPPHVIDGPDGAPVVVLANSLGTSSAMWAPQVGPLAQYRRVVRYEHRGHGGSSAPPGPYSIADLGGDVVELLDHLEVERASVCGVSLGGMVAMWIGSRHPERVDRLVLACTAAHLPPAEGWYDRASTVRAEGTGVLLPALLGRWFTPGFTERRPEAAAEVEAMLAACAPDGYAGCCEAIATMDQRGATGRHHRPDARDRRRRRPRHPTSDGAGAAPGHRWVGADRGAGRRSPRQHRATGPLQRRTARPPPRPGGGARAADRREVLGDAHVERSDATADAFRAPFLDLITRYAWGDIWTRPGLDRRTRSCITLAMLVALGRFDELALHVRGGAPQRAQRRGDRRGAAADGDLRRRPRRQLRLLRRPAGARGRGRQPHTSAAVSTMRRSLATSSS